MSAREAERRAFAELDETCPTVDRIFDKMCQQIKDEVTIPFRDALRRAFQEVIDTEEARDEAEERAEQMERERDEARERADAALADVEARDAEIEALRARLDELDARLTDTSPLTGANA